MNINRTDNNVILIVDDNPSNLELLYKHLYKSGYKVLVAQDGTSALRQAELAQPDLILLDIMMPGMDGYTTCRILKTNEATQDIPVIFITALPDTDSKLKAFSAGAVDYITKPFEKREVLARIQTHLTIRQLQTTLKGQIAERERAEQKLRESLDELALRNQELEAFAHTVAHDLKSPLGTLIGMAEVIEEKFDTFTSEELRTYLKSIARSGRKASNIVEELLILASVHQLDVKTLPLKMSSIVREARRRNQDAIESSHATIVMPEEWPTVVGYAPWIEEVWANYISNGIKYGGRPPLLTLGATPQLDGMTRFWVKDNGQGLTEEEQKKLFIPFSRVNKMRVEGHGLGLSIVRRIIEKLGGHVGVESTGDGNGSIFSFTLPTAPS